MITNYVKWKRKIKSRIAKAKGALNKEKNFFTTKLGFNLRKKVEGSAVFVAPLCIVLGPGHLKK
jgi:hypothetical protein